MADRVPAKIYFIFNDIHVPDQNKPLVDAACELLRDIKPHGIVLNGDILDLPEVSRHNAGSVAHLEGKRLAHTWTAGNKLLDQFDAAAGPRCKEKHFIEGNHEHRWQRWIESGDNVVFADDEATSLKYRLRLQQRGYVYHSGYPDAHVRIGKLLVTHGQWSGKYPAARHLERYQISVLVGHTHTDQTYHASTWEGQRGAYCNGHMADEDSDAMAYAPKPRAWIQGFSVVQVRPSGDFFVQPVRWVNGCFFYGTDIYPKRFRRAA